MKWNSLSMKWDSLSQIFSKIFEGAVSIERTYNDCDKALSKLREYNEKLEEMQKNNEDVGGFPADEKAELDEIVNRAVEGAKQLLSKKGERDWPGVFREMHKNLGNIYFELHEYDKVQAECEALEKYGEVGRQDAGEILQELKDKESSKVASPEEAPAAM